MIAARHPRRRTVPIFQRLPCVQNHPPRHSASLLVRRSTRTNPHLAEAPRTILMKLKQIGSGAHGAALFVNRFSPWIFLGYLAMVALQLLSATGVASIAVGGLPLLCGALLISVMFVARGVTVGKPWLGVLAAIVFMSQGLWFQFDQGATRPVTRIAGIGVVGTFAIVGWALYFSRPKQADNW
jgi:hypothetical protein